MNRILTIIVAVGLFLVGCGTVEEAPVAQSADKVRPLTESNLAPRVTLRDTDDRPVRLEDLLERQRTVLVFYRGGWCMFCTRQLADMQTAMPRLKELGFQIIAVAPDRPAKLRESLDKHRLGYTLLSDSDMEAAREFGVAFRLDDDTFVLYRDRYKIDIEDDSGREHHLLPVPTVYIIDIDRRIHWSHSDPDYKNRPSAETVIDEAEKLVRRGRLRRS